MNKLKKIIILAIFCLISMSAFSIVNAASASISSNKTSMKVGDTATITVSIKAAAWNVHVTGGVSKNLANVTDDGENTSTKSTISFKPSKAGTYTMNLSGDVTDGGTNKTSNVSGSVTIKVSEKTTSNNTSNNNSNNNSNTSSSNTSNSNTTKPKTNTGTNSNNTTSQKSNVATLSNLGITPYKYDFSTFRPGTTSYNINVPNEAETINIYATKSNSKATVTGLGSKKLNVGTNRFYVKVTAEDKKTTKTYTLIINRKEKEEESKEEEPEETTDDKKDEEKPEENVQNNSTTVGLTNIEVEGYTITPSFSSDVYEYKLKITEDIEKLNINTQTSDDSVEVDVIGNEELKEGENVVTVLVHNAKDDNTTTYQIIVDVDLSNINLDEINNEIEVAQRNVKRQKVIVIGTIAIIIILIIIFLVQRYKLQKSQDEIEFEEEKEVEDFIERHYGKSNKKGKRFK